MKPSKVFIDTMRELLYLGPVGSWRWQSRLRRADRAATEVFISAVLREISSEEQNENDPA